MAVAHWDQTVSQHVKMVLSAACALAAKAREDVGTDHLLLAVSYQNGPLWRAVIRDIGAEPLAFRTHIEAFVDSHSRAGTAPPGPSGSISPEANAVVGKAAEYGKERGGASLLDVGTLLLALAEETTGRIGTIVESYGISAAAFRDAVRRNLDRETDQL